MSLKKLVPHITVVICMGDGKEKPLEKELTKEFPAHVRAEFILCGGDVDKALQELRSSRVSRPEVRLYTDRFLPRGEWLFESARGVLTDYDVFYA